MISLYEVGLFPDSSPLFRSVLRFLFSSVVVWRLGLRHQRVLHHQLMKKISMSKKGKPKFGIIVLGFFVIVLRYSTY